MSVVLLYSCVRYSRIIRNMGILDLLTNGLFDRVVFIDIAAFP